VASEDRFVHRLEAFSDIVIGFSLAQLGVTLVVPPHAISLIADPSWFLLFAWTFGLVCMMWLNHNRIFRAGFIATPVTMLLNFLLLASIVLIVYFAQVYARVHTLQDVTIAGRFYFGALAFSTTITAVLYAIGTPLRRGTVVNTVAAALQWIAVAASFAVGDNAWMPLVMGALLASSWLIGSLVARRLAPAAA
jgi:uncharacterized membrane protein